MVPRAAFGFGVAVAAGAATLFLLPTCGGGSPGEGRAQPEPAVVVAAPAKVDMRGPVRKHRLLGPVIHRAKRRAPVAERRPAVLRYGASGPEVTRLQAALTRLRYWVGEHDGTYGVLTQQAVLALQGAAGLSRDGAFGPLSNAALMRARPPEARSRHGHVIEIDESKGLLLVVRDGRVQWAFHTSTGSNQPYVHPNGRTYSADTPNGRWAISWQYDGWREGPLGRMWRPKYFHADGIAIHGYASVPPYPASHGCVRVSVAAMNFIWNNGLAPPGTAVWVY